MTVSNISSKATKPIVTNFNISFRGGGEGWENKIYSNCPGHMANMAAMRIYGKIFNNLLLRNSWTDCLETWYLALGTPRLPSLFRWWTFVDLWPVYGKFKYGQMLEYKISWKVLKFWPNNWSVQLPQRVHEDEWLQEVNAILWLLMQDPHRMAVSNISSEATGKL